MCKIYSPSGKCAASGLKIVITVVRVNGLARLEANVALIWEGCTVGTSNVKGCTCES